MKKVILIATLFLTAFTSVVKAQDDNEPGAKRKERIQALYVAFITQRLSLTSEDAQKFWPVYNQYDNDIQNVRKDMPELEKQQTLLNIKKRYQDKFVSILGAERCEKFYKLDIEFKNKLIEMMKNRQNKPGGGKFRGGGNNQFLNN